MKAVRQLMTWLLISLVLVAAGCGIEFPDEEMDLAGSDRTRPYAVVFSLAEARPGETVTATLHLFEPDPVTFTANWRIALDYDIGLYETDEIERNHVAPTQISPPVFDAQGFGTQVVTFTVPYDILLSTSSQPEVIEDELILGALVGILPVGGSGVVTRAELDELLGTADGLSLTPEEMARLTYVADLFSCEIRFRAELRGSTTIDVTRNLTVRWSSRFGSANVNLNPHISSFDLVTIRRPDVVWDDVVLNAEDTSLQTVLVYPGVEPTPLSIETHANWTYYVRPYMNLQTYTSPFDPLTPLEEDFRVDWFHRDLDHPDSGHPLYVTEEGDPAEMGNLSNIVRLQPPTVTTERSFRFYCVARDRRWEWDMYSSVSGTSVGVGEITFVAGNDE